MEIKVVIFTNIRGKEYPGTLFVDKKITNKQEALDAVREELSQYNNWLSIGDHIILNINSITHIKIQKGQTYD